MADRARENSRDKKGQNRKDATRRDGMKDLPAREAKAENVKGGRDAASGLATGKRQHDPIQ